MPSMKALTTELASWSKESLKKLLTLRPDLLTPGLQELSELAARACSKPSVQRAVDSLPLPELQLLQAVVLMADEGEGLSCSSVELKHIVGDATLGQLDTLLGHLEQKALVYRAEPPENIHSASGSRRRYVLPLSRVQEVLGAYPAGLGRGYRDLLAASPAFEARAVEIANSVVTDQPPVEHPIAAAYALERWAALPECLDDAPPRAIEVLRRFATWPVGAILRPAQRIHPGPATEHPVDWLLSKGLLVPVDDEHVELPRPVGLALRSGRVIPSLAASAPSLSLTLSNREISAKTAREAVLDMIALVDGLVTKAASQRIRHSPGGVGAEDLHRIASALSAPPGAVSFALDVAATAGLLHVSPETSEWCTDTAESWRGRPPQVKWLQLATAWFTMSRFPSLDPPPPMPAPEHASVEAFPIRRKVLDALTEVSQDEEGQDLIVEADDLRHHLAWALPRVAGRIDGYLDEVLLQAEFLGVTGGNALTEHGRALVHGDQAFVLDSLARSLAPFPAQGCHGTQGIDDVVETLRRNYAASASSERSASPTVELLNAAVRERSTVALTVIDPLGVARVQDVVPLSISGSRLRLLDPSLGVERVIGLHRIVDVD